LIINNIIINLTSILIFITRKEFTFLFY